MEITGIIDEWGCPVLDCYIANIEKTRSLLIKCVIDTGSFDCHLKEDIIELLDLQVSSTEAMNHPKSGLIESKAYNVFIDTGGQIFKINALSMHASFNYACILGTKFIMGKSFSYDWKNKAWRIFW